MPSTQTKLLWFEEGGVDRRLYSCRPRALLMILFNVHFFYFYINIVRSLIAYAFDCDGWEMLQHVRMFNTYRLEAERCQEAIVITLFYLTVFFYFKENVYQYIASLKFSNVVMSFKVLWCFKFNALLILNKPK